MRAPTGFAANKRPPATSIRIRPSSDVEDRTELEIRANSMRWTMATDVPGVNDEFLRKNGLSPLARACPRAARALGAIAGSWHDLFPCLRLETGLVWAHFACSFLSSPRASDLFSTGRSLVTGPTAGTR